VRIVEFYCPGCSTQVETEYLPPGHPITHDIEIDVDRLKERLGAGELRIADQRLEVPR
jgi:acetone carboxylase, gamma subunit